MVATSSKHASSIDDVVGLLNSLSASLSGIACDALDSTDLRQLMGAIRFVQQAAGSLSMRIGVAADRLAEQGVGRGSHGLFLGDGRAVSGSMARREVARSSVLAEFDHVADAVQRGRIGAAQVDLFARAARKLDPEQRPELDDRDLVAAAANEPVDVFARRIRRFVDLLRGDHGRADAEAQRQASTWRSWIDNETGMGHVHGEFDPERFEAIRNAVEAHAARLSNRGGVQRTANLAATAAYELLTEQTTGHGGLPSIGVIVDWQTLTRGAHPNSIRETTNGQSLTPESISRLACHAVLQRIVVDHRGIPLDVGRRYRTATAAQWLALRAIYRSCAWIGCERPLSWCQIHHVHEWEHGGPTDLCNLVPLCSEHHHAVHEGGWSLKLWDDRRLDIQSPDGSHRESTFPDRRPALGATAHPNRPRTRAMAATHRPASHRPAQPAGP